MLKKTKKLLASGTIGIISMFAPSAAFAATTSNSIIPNQLNSVGSLGITDIVRAVIQFILVVAFVLAFIFLIIGSIRWITAGGDEKGVEKARGMITAALIGLVVVLIAFALVKLVESFFGVNIISGGVCVPTVTGNCAP